MGLRGCVCTPVLGKLYTHPPCGGTSGCGVHTSSIVLSLKLLSSIFFAAISSFFLTACSSCLLGCLRRKDYGTHPPCGGTSGCVCTPILGKLYTHPPYGGTSGCGVHTSSSVLSSKVFLPSPRRERLPREGGKFGRVKLG